MSFHLDLFWFAQRYTSLYEGLHRPSRREIDALERSLLLPREGDLSNDLDILRLKEIFEAVFKILGIRSIDWNSVPSANALPMMALIPGVGGRIVYAATSEGHWLMEGPSGTEAVYQLPEGAVYAALLAPAKQKEADSAYTIFKNALLEQKDIFVQASIATFLANFLALAASFYSMQVYDRVIPTQGVSTLIVLTVGVLLAAVLELFIKIARSHILEVSVKGMDIDLSHKIFSRLLGIRMDQFPASVGTISAQLRSYEVIRGFASSATLYLAVDAPFALLFLSVMAILGGWALAAIPAIFFVIAFLTGIFFGRQIAIFAESGNSIANKKLGLLVETVESAENIKANGSGWQHLARWNTLSRQSIADDLTIRRYSEQASFLAAFMQQISYALLVAAGAYVAATTTNLTMGGVIACSILSGRVLGPVGALPGLIVQWAHAKAALDGLNKVFSLQLDNHEVARPLRPEVIRGDYKIQNLRFSYPGKSAGIDIPRLEIKAGEKIAILGSVGAGKSTLLKIMSGLFKQNEGQVLFDGLDIYLRM